MAIRSSATAALLLSLMALLSALIVSSPDLGFTCTTQATCKSVIDYVSPNTTTLANISSLFGVTNFYDLLGANSLAVSTKPSQIFKANNTIKIPFPCICSNDTGISNKVPVYTVQPNDGLDHIARDVFSALVTYQQIARVNNIPNPNLILTGQKLWIPLPCSCDEVSGAQVVHYGHVVAKGSSVEQIAEEYGTDQNTLLKLNGMSNTSELIAGEVLDVPLKVCSSSVNKTSEDYPLLVPNGTYALTAYNCVKCSCQSSNNYTLHCNPSEVTPSNVTKCPSMLCQDGSVIGNTTSTCSTCAYAGFIKTSILTTLDNSTCSSNSAPSPSSNSAQGRFGSQGSSWSVLLATIHLGLLCFGLLC
ncbi:lysM domain-containing GPI-anchored protein 2-like [Macadamia integrifolia]|uniref:lysM domain-containing GPI-anchored protein 2-like n=1 Tax=Macadamia integrifolia TaxID=60698 RepID=UPI001C4F797B|nr:lysM domain-containing GPI-anchored protein 2-like [Macadamia integrifolia]